MGKIQYNIINQPGKMQILEEKLWLNGNPLIYPFKLFSFPVPFPLV